MCVCLVDADADDVVAAAAASDGRVDASAELPQPAAETSEPTPPGAADDDDDDDDEVMENETASAAESTQHSEAVPGNSDNNISRSSSAGFVQVFVYHV